MSNFNIRHFHLHRGFTIVELVVTIVVSAIVVGFVMMFMTTPVDAYLAQSRRAELTTEADLIARNIDRDVRNAVPNSVRAVRVGNVVTVEMLAVVDMANYRNVGTNNITAEELNIAGPDNNFSTLGWFNHLPPPPFTMLFNRNDHFLVINNDSNVLGRNAYAGDSVITPPGTNITIVNRPGLSRIADVTLSALVTFGVGPSPGSPLHNVFLVSGPVAYECNENTHILTRFEGYVMAPGIAANRNAATSRAVISQDIELCESPAPVSATAPAHQFLSWNIQLKRALTTEFMRAATGELMQVYVQSQVENLP